MTSISTHWMLNQVMSPIYWHIPPSYIGTWYHAFNFIDTALSISLNLNYPLAWEWVYSPSRLFKAYKIKPYLFSDRERYAIHCFLVLVLPDWLAPFDLSVCILSIIFSRTFAGITRSASSRTSLRRDNGLKLKEKYKKMQRLASMPGKIQVS